MDMIATTGTTTPVVALSFVVKPEEIFAAAELIVGLEELLFEAGVGVVVGADGIVVFVGVGPDVALAYVTLETFTSSVANATGFVLRLQVGKPR